MPITKVHLFGRKLETAAKFKLSANGINAAGILNGVWIVVVSVNICLNLYIASMYIVLRILSKYIAEYNAHPISIEL